MTVLLEAIMPTFGSFCRAMRVVVCVFCIRLFWAVLVILSTLLGPALKLDAGFDLGYSHREREQWNGRVEESNACH
jgi:hypothetical protein